MSKVIGIVPPYGMTFYDLFAEQCPWYAPTVSERAEYLLKKYIEGKGYDIVDATVKNASLQECCAIIHWSRVDKTLLHNAPNAVHIYMAFEPYLVRTYNAPFGLRQLSHVMDYSLSLYVTAEDSKRGIRTGPGYYNFEVRFAPPSAKKYLLASVSGDKDAILPQELYTSRRRVIDWFEQNHPSEFRFYGSGWSEGYKGYKTYGGEAKCKLTALSEAVFSLCFENVRDQQGGISEKLFDGMNAGTIPIYRGSKDIEKWVPADLYIDYRQFNTPEKLYKKISSMDKSEIDLYLKRAQEWLHSKNTVALSWENVARQIIECIEAGKRAHPTALDYFLMGLQFKINAVMHMANECKHRHRIKREHNSSHAKTKRNFG